MKAQRVFAYIIDGILIGIMSSILCAIFGLQISTLWSNGAGIDILFNPVALFTLAMAALYFMTDVMYNGSPGKKLLGLSVVQSSPEKDRFSTAATRALVKVLSIHLIIGVILFITGDQDSSLHDRLAGTKVQKKLQVA